MAFVKTAQEIALMRIAGKILGKTLGTLKGEIRPGISGLELDKRARKLIEALGGEPAFLGYRPDGADRPYPATLCVSINEVVVHGVPTSRKIKEGDLVKLDLGVRVKGYYADAAITVAVGEIPKEARTLITATEKALLRGIRAARPGNALGDIGHSIQKVARAHGLSVIRGLTGHGIGSNLHEDPVVLNEGNPGKGMRLKAGMTIAIEPMFSLGAKDIVQQSDEGYATKDKSLSAHFEHTILIMDRGSEILTML
jgi:methionyl aminopeptidase